METLSKKYLSAFQDISAFLDSTVNLQKILNLIVEKITLSLGVKGTSIAVFENGDGRLRSAASYGLNGKPLSESPQRMEKSMLELLKQKTFLRFDATDSRSQYQKVARQEGDGAVLSIPLRVNENIHGVLEIISAEEYTFAREEMAFVLTVCRKIASAVETAFQYELVEDNHESISPDLWRWFKLKSYPGVAGHHHRIQCPPVSPI